MELQMVFTISASADPIKYWHILARVQNRLFQFREKLVVVIAVLVDVLVCIFKQKILQNMCSIKLLTCFSSSLLLNSIYRKPMSW